MDLREQIANALLAHHCERSIICEHTQVIEYGAMSDAVMTVVQPALDAKDALITRLLAEKREIDQARITAERLNDGLRAKLAEVAALDQPGDQTKEPT